VLSISMRSFFLSILLAFSVIILGCNDDDGPVNPPTEVGSVLITIQPDTLQAPWALTIPGGLMAVGQGDSLLAEMPVGQYTIAWDSVGPWYPGPSLPVMPAPLAAGDTLVLSVVYEFREEPAGVAAIRIEPDWLDAPWVLSGPNGFITDGTHGSLDWQHLEGGDYTIAWGTVDGWQAPTGETLSLAEGDTITFTGVYTADPALTGTVRVDVEPENLEVDWSLTGPDGFTLSGNGDVVLENVAVGDYHIVWGEEPLWSTPGDETQALAAADTVTFAGTYEPGLTSPDQLMSGFMDAHETYAADVFPEFLDSGFRLILLQETIDEWAGGDQPLTSDHFGLEAFAAIYSNIFAGETGVDPSGNPIPPVLAIEVPVMQMLAPWEAVDVGMEYFGGIEGAYTTSYNLLMNFNLPGNSRFQVDGTIRFVVKETEAGWRLLGIIPLGRGGKATESWTYDAVLTLYR